MESRTTASVAENHEARPISATLAILSRTRHYRECLLRVLSAGREFTVLHSGDYESTAMHGLGSCRPDVALLDLCGVAAVPTVQHLAGALPQTALVVVRWDDDDSQALKLFEAGLTGFVPLEGSLDDLENVIRSALRHEVHYPPSVAAALVRRLRELAHEGPSSGSEHLSARELAVLELIERRLTNKEIAHRLGIEASTVKNHVHRILKKLSVRRRDEAVAYLRHKTPVVAAGQGLRGSEEVPGSSDE